MTENALHERPTVGDVINALGLVAAVVPFFPQGPALAVVAGDVHRFVGTREQLDWFQRKARGSLSTYDGLPQLRALYATKYEPFDGVAPIVHVAGFEADALEASYSRRVMNENEQRMEAYRREALLAPAEDRAPLELPIAEVKALPPAPIASGVAAVYAGAQVENLEAAIRCSWCAEGYSRVRSSVSSAYVHLEVPYAGRVVCKHREALPSDLSRDPMAVAVEKTKGGELAGPSGEATFGG
jgi:hypothetical protein